MSARQRKPALRLPAWWQAQAPGKPASFWIKVNDHRRRLGIKQTDRAGMTNLIYFHLNN